MREGAFSGRLKCGVPRPRWPLARPFEPSGDGRGRRHGTSRWTRPRFNRSHLDRGHDAF